MASANALVPSRSTAGTPSTVPIFSELQGAAMSTTAIRLAAEVEAKIRTTQRNLIPFTTIVDHTTKKEMTKQFVNEYMEQNPIPQTCTVTADAAAAAATITVTNGAWIQARSLLHDPLTGQQLSVTSVSSNTVTVATAYSDEGIDKAIPAGTVLGISLPVGAESQEHFKGISRGVANGSFYVGERGWGVGHSDWVGLVGWRSGSEIARLDEQAVTYFNEGNERAYMFTRPYYSATTGLNTRPEYIPGGLEYWCELKNNIVDMCGSIDYDSWVGGIRPIMRYGTGTRILAICGLEMCDRVTRLPGFRNRMRTGAGEKSFGFEMDTIKAKGVEIAFVPHPMMDELGRENQVLLTTTSDLVRVVMQDTVITNDVQPNGQHTKEREFRIIDGMKHLNPRAAGKFINCF